MPQEADSVLLLILSICFAVLWSWRRRDMLLPTKFRKALLPFNKLTPSEEQIQNANQAERAINFFRVFTARTKLFLVVLTGLALAVTMTFYLPESSLQWAWWLIVCTTILVCEMVILRYLQKWMNRQERFLIKQVYQIEETILQKSGIITTNPATGLYTRQFAEHMLELYTSRLVGRVLPVTCLVLEVVGLDELKTQQGEQVTNQVMSELAGLILKRVRISDIVYQSTRSHLGIVLLRYPARPNDVIEKYILLTCYSVLEKYNTAYHCDLQIHWSGAILPLHARTPTHMLHISEASLEAILAINKQTQERNKAMRQQAQQ
jgi:GGDEF domain-containing protein